MHFFVVFKKLHVILRLYGYKRYDSMDGGGRAMHGAIAESNAGAVAEQTKQLTILFGDYHERCTG
jgi:hypothetical protein